MPLVIDCNVLVAGVLNRTGDSPPTVLLQMALDATVDFLLSQDLMDEYRLVLRRPHLQRRHGLTDTELEVLLGALAANCQFLEPEHAPAEGPDPGDVHLWRLLRASPEAVLVTGDRALQDAAPVWAHVLSPREWLDRHNNIATPSVRDPRTRPAD